MNKKLLCAALLGVSGLCAAQAASAQVYDDRWYVTGSAGFNLQDNDRNTEDTPFLTAGFGKFINPYWSVDGEFNYQNPGVEANPNLNFSQYGVSFDLRRHFRTVDRNWWPYIVGGLGYQRVEEEFDRFPFPDSPGQREDGNLSAKLGVGLQSDVGRVGVRTELAYRVDFDDSAVAPRNDGSIDDADSFADLLGSIGIVIPLGPEPVGPIVAPRRPPRAAPTWMTTVTASTTATTVAPVPPLARPSVRTAARCRSRSTCVA